MDRRTSRLIMGVALAAIILIAAVALLVNGYAG
jgi:hypothetical protein